MIVECGHCGAPLDVKEGEQYTRCKYCRKTSERRQLRTIQAQTPLGWRPPAVWTPPNTNVALKYAAAATVAPAIIAFIALAIVGAVGVGVAVSVSSKRKGTSPFLPSNKSRVSLQVLEKITLEESPEELEKLTGVAMDGQKSMRVPIQHPNWEAVTFRWDADHLEHVKDFYFNGTKDPSGEGRKRLKALLGRRWENNGFTWEGAGLNISDNHLGANVTITQHGKEKEENPQWKQQTETLWKLARHAVLGVGEPPSKKELRDYLGLGYPLSNLLQLDTDADIDGAGAAMKKVYPGAVRNLFIDLDYKAAIDHPLFSSAEISWNNKKGARVKDLELRPPLGTNNKFPNQKGIDDCVTAAFGKPDRQSSGPHLGDTSYDTIWKPAAGGYIRVYSHMIVVSLRDNPFGKPMPRDVWEKTVTALDQCGKAAK